jgi:hypothetical protein
MGAIGLLAFATSDSRGPGAESWELSVIIRCSGGCTGLACWPHATSVNEQISSTTRAQMVMPFVTLIRSRPVETAHTFMKLQGHGRRGILVGHNLDVCTSAALRGGFKGLIEFSACADTCRKPIVASKRPRQVGVVPLSKIVVLDVRIIAEQPFN